MGGIEQLGQIFTHTPVWVWVLLAVLVAIGAQAMRPRIVPPRRLLITPAVFIVWGLIGLFAKPHFTAMLGVDWIVAAAFGAALGWSTTRLRGLRVDRASGRAHLPGSPVLLIRILLVFWVKFFMGVAMAINPGAAIGLAPWDVAVSGLMAGYFLGWLLRFWSRYRIAPTATTEPFNSALVGATE
jgi:hypothetical protein